jgi:hypothetical protein
MEPAKLLVRLAIDPGARAKFLVPLVCPPLPQPQSARHRQRALNQALFSSKVCADLLSLRTSPPTPTPPSRESSGSPASCLGRAVLLAGPGDEALAGGKAATGGCDG